MDASGASYSTATHPIHNQEDKKGVYVEVVKRVVELMAEKTEYYMAQKRRSYLDDKIKYFETTVLAQQHTGEVQVVGIVGLGGVRKTTLAKDIFYGKHSEYNNSYFLSVVNARISLHAFSSSLLFHRYTQTTSSSLNDEKATRGIPRYLESTLNCPVVARSLTRALAFAT